MPNIRTPSTNPTSVAAEPAARRAPACVDVSPIGPATGTTSRPSLPTRHRTTTSSTAAPVSPVPAPTRPGPASSMTLRLPRTVAAQVSENGFQAATMARFEMTFGPLFGHHPERLQQQFWITDETVIIATEIHGQPQTVHAIVPITYHHDTPNSTRQNGPTP